MDKTNTTLPVVDVERRASVRVRHDGTVKIRHSSFGEKVLKVRDLSETGAFLFCKWGEMPCVGSLIGFQLQGGEGLAPWVMTTLVRWDRDGVGVAFCEDSEV